MMHSDFQCLPLLVCTTVVCLLPGMHSDSHVAMPRLLGFGLSALWRGSPIVECCCWLSWTSICFSVASSSHNMLKAVTICRKLTLPVKWKKSATSIPSFQYFYNIWLICTCFMGFLCCSMVAVVLQWVARLFAISLGFWVALPSCNFIVVATQENEKEKRHATR